MMLAAVSGMLTFYFFPPSEVWFCFECFKETAQLVPALSLMVSCAQVCRLMLDQVSINVQIQKSFEEKARVKDDFVACVSHELRSPVRERKAGFCGGNKLTRRNNKLNGVLGCVDLIAREAKIRPEARLEDMAENLGIINHCGTLLSVLMENLLSKTSHSGAEGEKVVSISKVSLGRMWCVFLFY